jgi:hypothetical protein
MLTPIKDPKPGDIQLKDIIQHDGEASSDAAAAINADRLITARSGSQTSPPNLDPVSNEDSLGAVSESLQTILPLAALGDRLASKTKRGLIGAVTGGLLSGDDPLGGLLSPVEGLMGLLRLDSLLGGSGGGLSGEIPAAAP